MARRTTVIEWHEVGYWTTDEDGRNVEWHVVGAYAKRATANGDIEKAQRHYDATLLVRMKRVSVITD